MSEGAVDFQVPAAGLLCLGELGARWSFLATLTGDASRSPELQTAN